MASGAEVAQGELYCPSCEQTFARGERCPEDNTRLVRLASTTDRLIGRELDGRYTIVEKLGQGGMGAVYRGTQHSVGREVAIKVVTPSLVSDGVAIKRFLREAKLASRLSHPNAVSVLDFGQTDDGLFYLIMELVGGRTLDKLLEAERVLPPARVVRIGAQICDALEGAHELQIVHRDLKPQNVMVLSKGRDHVKVLDFGLAKSLTPDPSSTTMTNAGALLGTPAFMPPELVTGQDCDARADLYSLGCILYLCATGRLPFEAATMHELIAMHASDPVPRPTGVPPRLAAVIERLLEKQPARRYQTAAQVRDALEASLATETGVVAQPIAEAMATGPATLIGWTNTTPAVHPRMPTPVSGVPRMPTPVSGVPHVPAPVSGVPHVPAPVLPRITTPPRGVPHVASAPTLLATPSYPSPGVAGAEVAPRTSRVPLIAGALIVILVAAALTFMAVRDRNEPPPAAPAASTNVDPVSPPAPAVEAPAPPPAVEAPAPPPAAVEAPPPTAPAVEAPPPPAPAVEAPPSPPPAAATRRDRAKPPPKPAPSTAKPARPKPSPPRHHDPKHDAPPPNRPVVVNPGAF